MTSHTPLQLIWSELSMIRTFCSVLDTELRYGLPGQENRSC